MSFFRQNAPLFSAVGAGAVLCYMYWRMTARILRELENLHLQELENLRGVVQQLQNIQSQIDQLHHKVDRVSKRRRGPGSGFFSIATSSGEEEDDVYEEAYGGSDFDPLQEIALQEVEDQIIVPTQEQDTESSVQHPGTELFAAVDQLVEGTDLDKQKAFDLLQNKQGKFSNDPEYFWRLSKSTYQVSQIIGAEGDTEKKKKYMYDANSYAETALNLDESCANAHKWFAITIGSVGEFEGTQQKIQNGFKYKEHIEKAIGINPTDPSNHYLLGRWCYSVYMLSWIERKAAATLFATPPSATIDETLTHFLKADELKPGAWKDNHLFVAKCYIEKRMYKEAVKWLVKGKQVPTVSVDDKAAETEIDTLLVKYNSY
ncbi:regulator of microtubule dynamics protein 1-like isoform X2 [Dreissena polymorpha]|uniref:regulator of microtubule dynamics protein 1-like isoform X2 n=1 Tax=Dreissena polymorpha TaxID=45954 RepID=UPI002263C101|nr:regulator of microtubule dynamics protein 1-like isoform X2 [Dreissena polymorpha]